MSDNAHAADDVARQNKITALTVLATELSNTASQMTVAVSAAKPVLPPLVVAALDSTIGAVRSAAEMIDGQLALIPPPVPAVGDEAPESDD